MRRGCSVLAWGLVPALMTAAPPDGTRLLETVRYYNQVGTPGLPKAEDTYPLLSAESRRSISPQDWAEINRKPYRPKGVEILGQRVHRGRTFAIVSVRESANLGCLTLTQSWILEEGRWKRFNQYHLMKKRNERYDAGDFSGAWQLAAEMLEGDPFDPDGWATVLMCRKRGGKEPVNSPHLTDAELIARALACNPMDSTANLIGTSFCKDAKEAWGFLEKLEGTKDFVPAASNVCINLRDPRAVLAFLHSLEERRPLEGELLMAKAEAFVRMSRWKEAGEMLQDPRILKSMRGSLGGYDPVFKATRTVVMGMACLATGGGEGARAWLAFGKTLHADSLLLQTLEDAVGAKDPQAYARAWFAPRSGP